MKKFKEKRGKKLSKWKSSPKFCLNYIFVMKQPSTSWEKEVLIKKGT